MATEPFRHRHRVTYAECTLGNHLYYARYLDLLEAARGELFRHLGLTCLQLQQQDTALPVIECRLRYKFPARYDDELTVEVTPTLAGKLRLNFSYRVLNQNGRPVLEAVTFHICTRLNEKPKRLPGDLLRRLEDRLPLTEDSPS